jgi:ketosteroid isomerase-like protein
VKIGAILALFALFLAGCAKKNDTPEAVKQGVIRDLAASGKFDMQKMDVIVDSVSFRDKEADATVTFAPKGGSAAEGMAMKYVLERHDDGQWYIKTRSAGDTGAVHGASGSTMPPGHPDLGQPQ